jgi:nucleotide-binding universal stress UspA family protein
MPMYHKILVAYDGTDSGDAALRLGVELARMAKAELHVLGVVVSSGGLLLNPVAVAAELLETERRFLLEALESAVSALGDTGTRITTCLRDGDAADEILLYAHEIKADLAVVGHGEKGLMARWIEGSVGGRLLKARPCSLLVARRETAPGARL